MTRPTAHVMCGIPASGKSEFARALPALRFNLDDIRKMMGFGSGEGQGWTREREDVAIAAMIAGAKAALESGQDVCLDNTHISPSLPRRYRKEFSPIGVDWEVHSFWGVSVDECIRRDAERGEPVGEAVIRRMAKQLDENKWRLTEKWLKVPEYPKPEPYVAHTVLTPAYICDVDGTVALNTGTRSPYDWSRVGEDEPNVAVVRVLKRLEKKARIIFMSGRDEECRATTVTWLVGQMPWLSTIDLFMRPQGDTRPDWVVKAELFDAHVRDQYNVLGVFDDRDQVVRMWREMGLTVLQVADGNF